MARIRTIKPSIFSSLTVSSWPIEARWTFAGLLTYLDDAGRGIDEARLVKAELYPLDDKMTPAKVDKHLALFAEDGPLCRYSHNGIRYMHVTSWAEHQRINRPTPSKFPACPQHEDEVSAA